VQPTRMIFDDAPAFIPVPSEFWHHRVEVTLWPLEVESPSSLADIKPPVKPTDSALKRIQEREAGLEAAQQDAMTRMWDNETDEVWNHVERL
jgi:hypothetical protein